MMKNPDEIWARILSHAGEEFQQIRGKSFTYEIDGEYVSLHSTNQKISKNQFAEGLEHVPLENTVPLQHLRGPSYIFAILMDKRIRLNDW